MYCPPEKARDQKTQQDWPPALKLCAPCSILTVVSHKCDIFHIETHKCVIFMDGHLLRAITIPGNAFQWVDEIHRTRLGVLSRDPSRYLPLIKPPNRKLAVGERCWFLVP